jgi:hypothetical protein
LRRVAPHSWIPWAIATVALAVFAPLFVVQLLFVGAGTDLIWATIMIVLASGLLIVGALISSRQPENSIGLLLLGSGLLSVVGVAGAPIAVIAQERFGETGPLLVLLGWIGSWSSSPLLVLLVVILPLIFPTASSSAQGGFRRSSLLSASRLALRSATPSAHGSSGPRTISGSSTRSRSASPSHHGWSRPEPSPTCWGRSRWDSAS